MYPNSTLKRFWNQVKVGAPDECWPWQGRKNNNFLDWQAYGRFYIRKGKDMLAHRFVWETTYGPIPHKMLVCHTCDTPPCCNHTHLFLGSHSDNTQDRIKKHGNWQGKGEDALNAKHKTEDVLEMRRLYDSGTPPFQIAKIFGSNYHTVWNIVTRRSWKHL